MMEEIIKVNTTSDIAKVITSCAGGMCSPNQDTHKCQLCKEENGICWYRAIFRYSNCLRQDDPENMLLGFRTYSQSIRFHGFDDWAQIGEWIAANRTAIVKTARKSIDSGVLRFPHYSDLVLSNKEEITK